MSVTVVVLVFAGLVILRVLLVAVGAMAIIRPVRACPACFEDTIPIQKPLLERLSHRFEWRWCPACGWEGIARRLHRTARPASPQPGPPSRVGEARTGGGPESDRTRGGPERDRPRPA